MLSNTTMSVGQASCWSKLSTLPLHKIWRLNLYYSTEVCSAPILTEPSLLRILNIQSVPLLVTNVSTLSTRRRCKCNLGSAKPHSEPCQTPLMWESQWKPLHCTNIPECVSLSLFHPGFSFHQYQSLGLFSGAGAKHVLLWRAVMGVLIGSLF